jgi:hypothetical protein
MSSSKNHGFPRAGGVPKQDLNYTQICVKAEVAPVLVIANFILIAFDLRALISRSSAMV